MHFFEVEDVEFIGNCEDIVFNAGRRCFPCEGGGRFETRGCADSQSVHEGGSEK